MRSREEIEDDAKDARDPHKSDQLLELILEVMLDTREILQETKVKLD
jgi:hypothetical protein